MEELQSQFRLNSGGNYMTKKVGFIGAGYMGYGMAKNILKNNFDLSVIAHKNREPIEKLLKLGANEV